MSANIKVGKLHLGGAAINQLIMETGLLQVFSGYMHVPQKMPKLSQFYLNVSNW